MRTRSVTLVVGLFGVIFGFGVPGCGSSSPSSTTPDASPGKDSGHPKPDSSSEPDSSNVDSGKSDSSSKDVTTSDAPTEAACAMTLCGTACVDTSTDGKDCGKCGHSCLGGTCTAGKCDSITMVDPTVMMATEIVDADTNGTVVVWGDGGDSTLDQVSTPGGTKIVLVNAGPDAEIANVAMGAGGALGYTVTNPGSFNTATLGMASSSTLANNFGLGVYTFGLAWDSLGKNAFINIIPSLTAGPYELLTCPAAGGCSAIVSTPGANPVLSDVAASSAAVVFGDRVANNVNVYDPTTMKLSATISSQANVYYVAADTKNVYWTTSVATVNGIFSAAIGSTTVTTVLAATIDTPIYGLATDGTNLYYVNSLGLYYVPVGGASTPTVIDTTGEFYGVKYANNALVYWTGQGIYLIATP